MIHISLFSGIGGFELAAEWMGWRNWVSCDINEFGNKVREYYWPEGYCHKDVKTLTYETIDHELSARFGPGWRDDDIILTGGFPCQPYSAAGKRLGKDDERHLWPEMLRVISEVKPTYIVGENVRGLTNWNGGVVFEEVCADLEAIGYEVQPILLPACAVGAPHRRDRIWFVAYSNGSKLRANEYRSIRSENGENKSQRSQGIHNAFGSNGFEGDAADTESQRTWQQSSENRGRQDRRSDNDGKDGDASDTDCGRLERSTEVGWDGINVERESEFGNAADTDSIGSIQRNTIAIGELSKRNGFEALCQPTNWQNFPTESPICGGDDGLPTRLDSITFSKWRNESIKAYGNAIVSKLAYQIFKALINK